MTDNNNNKEIFEKALTVFTKQAQAGLEDDDATLASVELAKTKANAFLDAVGNVLTIKHELDIIDSSDEGFKRRDELSLLNSLREQCNVQADAALKLSEYISNTVKNAIDGTVGAELDVSGAIGLLDYATNTTQKIIKGTNDLIKLERMSGNRQWGQRKSSTANISYIQGLEGDHVDHMGKALEYYKNGNLSIEGFAPRKLKIEEVS